MVTGLTPARVLHSFLCRAAGRVQASPATRTPPGHGQRPTQTLLWCVLSTIHSTLSQSCGSSCTPQPISRCVHELALTTAHKSAGCAVQELRKRRGVLETMTNDEIARAVETVTKMAQACEAASPGEKVTAPAVAPALLRGVPSGGAVQEAPVEGSRGARDEGTPVQSDLAPIHPTLV